jgi:2-C-methyl-D-erythritol 4-phosphate cytidylyltransferase
VLIRAHAAATTDEATDDAALAESLGVSVVTVPGAAAAMKVTTREDLVVAESLLAERGDRVR